MHPLQTMYTNLVFATNVLIDTDYDPSEQEIADTTIGMLKAMVAHLGKEIENG